MNPCARDCRTYAAKAKLDDCPNTAAVLHRAAQVIEAQEREITRLRSLLRRAMPRPA